MALRILENFVANATPGPTGVMLTFQDILFEQEDGDIRLMGSKEALVFQEEAWIALRTRMDELFHERREQATQAQKKEIEVVRDISTIRKAGPDNPPSGAQ